MIKKLKSVGYGRTATVEATRETCDVCGELKDCLLFDNSEGEYGSVSLCRQCIEALFTELFTTEANTCP